MEIFNLTLQQMLQLFTFMLIGFLLRKKSILPDNAHTTLSKLETYFIVPALNLYTMMTQCTVENLTQNAPLILYGTVAIFAVMAIAYPLSRLFVRKADGDPEREYQRNVYKYAMVFANYSFAGIPIIIGVFPELLFKFYMFTFVSTIICGSWGLFVLIPKDKSAGVWANLRKGLITPPTIALLIGMVLGLLNIGQYLPPFALKALSGAKDCMGPIAMVLGGFVVGGYNFKSLINNKKVYIATFMRLIVFPGIMILIMKALGMTDDIMILALVVYATPLGLNTIIYPAAYGGDTKTGASMAMISHTLSVITIPLMYLLFIVVL